MKVVVLGSRGQLGTELCRQLKGIAVPLDRTALDLRDRNAVMDRLLEIAPQAVINTAAYTAVDRAEQEAALCQAINADAVQSIVEACRRLDCRLLQVSTDYVFGGDAQRASPYDEQDLPSPQGAYARSKVESESLAASYARHFIVRTCGLYGLRESKPQSNFVETILSLARERDCLRVVNDQHCTPSFVGHVAAAIVFLVHTQAYGMYHIVNQGATTWYDFAAEILRESGINTRLEPITSQQYRAPAPRPSYSVLDTAKYRRLGGPPLPTWQQGLKEYLALRRAAGMSA